MAPIRVLILLLGIIDFSIFFYTLPRESYTLLIQVAKTIETYKKVKY